MSRRLVVMLVVGVVLAATAAFVVIDDDDHLSGPLESANGSSEELSGELLDRLACDAADSGDYEIAMGEAFKGTDCWTSAGQFRVHVYDNRARRDGEGPGMPEGTSLRIDIGSTEATEGQPLRPSVHGNRWVVIADSEEAARYAAERLGGVLSSSVTPVSYPFPTEIPADALERGAN